MATIINIGGTYTVTSSGSFSLVILANSTFVDSQYDVTLGDIFAVGTTFVVSDGGIIALDGLFSLSLFDSFDIGNTGTLEVGSAVNLSVASQFVFTNTAGTSAELVFASGLNIDLFTPGISGFKSGSEIELSGQTITGTAWNQSTGLLTVTTTTGSDTLAFQGNYTNSDFTFSGSDILFACFAGGTLIDGPNGPVPVETLAEGDRVCVASGTARPVKWIGFRTLDLTRYPDTRMAHPVRIVAGAFGEGLPRHDLVVSPDHALLVDEMLIPARMLVNDMTIRRETQCRSVTYFHVELDTHDILLAEGLPAESYLDTGNRGMFENHDGAIEMRPDFADVEASQRRALGCCRPFVVDGDRVKTAWERLARRAESLGHWSQDATGTTDEPDLVLLAGGRRLRPVCADGDRYVFVLPAVVGDVRLVSRSMVPSDARPWLDDRRRLGVMIRQMVVRTADDQRTIPVDHPRLSDGWWDVEAANGSIGRWTNGDAAVGPLPGRAMLTVELAGRLPSYPLAGDVADCLAA